MKNLRLIRKNREHPPLTAHYEREVIARIRKRYSVNQELAILRQRDTKPSEFQEYNAYVEQCKAGVRQEIFGEDSL